MNYHMQCYFHLVEIIFILSQDKVLTSTFQAIQNCFRKDILVKSSEYLANCNFANLLVCHTKRLSFNRNASSKIYKFFGKITSKFVGT